MRKTILSQLSSKSAFGGMEFSLTFDGSRINPQTVTNLQIGEGKRRKEFAEWYVEWRAEWYNYAKYDLRGK